MLKRVKGVPLDYSLCAMTVTVYGKDGSRRVLEGVHYELTDRVDVTAGMASHSREFLLVIPGADPVTPGDRVVLGIGPEVIARETLNTASVPTLGVVRTVKPRYFRGIPCHTEARGQ